jgi:hypothetical protein
VETPVFRDIEAQKELAKLPLFEILTRHRRPFAGSLSTSISVQPVFRSKNRHRDRGQSLPPGSAMMYADRDESSKTAAMGILPAVSSHIARRRLGPSCSYLIGSLAHGGFSRRYSDVDMLW